jgi:hypothetical protein
MGGAAWALPDPGGQEHWAHPGELGCREQGDGAQRPPSGEAIATLLAPEGASFREIDLDPAHFTRTTCCA